MQQDRPYAGGAPLHEAVRIYRLDKKHPFLHNAKNRSIQSKQEV